MKKCDGGITLRYRRNKIREKMWSLSRMTLRAVINARNVRNSKTWALEKTRRYVEIEMLNS